MRSLIDYVDSCCPHAVPRKRSCEACMREAQEAQEALNLHDAGMCHRGDTPCPHCGKSAENTMTRGEE